MIIKLDLSTTMEKVFFPEPKLSTNSWTHKHYIYSNWRDF